MHFHNVCSLISFWKDCHSLCLCTFWNLKAHNMSQRVKELEKAWCEFWVSSAVSFVPWSRKHEKAVVSRKTSVSASAFQLWEDSKPTNGDANKADWWSAQAESSRGASASLNRSLKSWRVRHPGIQPRYPPCLDKDEQRMRFSKNMYEVQRQQNLCMNLAS